MPFTRAEGMGGGTRGCYAAPHPQRAAQTSISFLFEVGVVFLDCHSTKRVFQSLQEWQEQDSPSHIMLSQVVTRGELLGPQSVTIPSIISFAQTITLGRMSIHGWLWRVWVSAYAEASHHLSCDILSEVFGIETTWYVLIIRALQG